MGRGIRADSHSAIIIVRCCQVKNKKNTQIMF